MRMRVAGWLLFVAVMVVPLPAAALGPTLNHCTFTWDAAAMADLAVFNVYLGSSSGGPYALIASYPGTPNVAKTYGPTPNLCVGQTDGQKFAVVKAADAAGNESGGSNEVPFAYDATAPAAAPTNLRVQ